MKLKNISIIKIGYSLREQLPKNYHGDIYIIQPKDIACDGKINFSETSALSLSTYEKHLLVPKEILLTSRGRFEAVVFTSQEKQFFIASSLFLRIVITNNKIMPEYLTLYLNSQPGQQQLKKISGTSGNMSIPIITKKQIEDLEIPILSLEEQKKLIDLVATFNKWKKLYAQKEKLQSQLINTTITNSIGAQNV